MHRRTDRWYFLVALGVACTARTVPQEAGAPIPLSSLPNPVPLPRASSWTFNYAPGIVSYQISRSAAIESQSDSGYHRETSTNITHELVTLEPSGDTIQFIAVVDTFATTTHGMIGPAQSIQLPVQLLGALVGDSLIFAPDSVGEKCNPASSTLSTDLHNLLVRFPVQLSQESRWRDSVELKACQGMIPTTAYITRSYIVSGETGYQGYPVLVVQRTDTIRARGEGSQQQHRLTLDANGTGSAIYYLSSREGRIVHLSAAQGLDLAITVAGKVQRFKQSSMQDFSYDR